MATPAYIPIYTTTLASSASSVLMAGIPQGYADLVLVLDLKTTNNREIGLQFNGDSTGHYSFVQAIGNGSTTSSNSSSTRTYARIIQTPGSSNSGMGVVSIMDYTANKHKAVLTRSNHNAEVKMLASRWPDTSAITSITVMNNLAEDFLAGSTISLFGILGTE